MAALSLVQSTAELERRLALLQAQGVVLVDPRQVYLAPEIDLARIESGVVLYPGVSLYGERTYLAAGVEIGSEGAAVVRQSLLGPQCKIASGLVDGAVLLDGASLGANAHVRPGTLLEEQASTAHAVGLKQTILLPYVTLGSLINFCDCLMAGGRSRHDHSEVGSGYIHFNFTPWGERGDKATPSLFGDVTTGVFGRSDRIFLGGLGASVGPRQVGFGAVAAAGQVLRRDLPANTLALEPSPAIKRPFTPGELDAGHDRLARNLAYIGQLAALCAWYRSVRYARAIAHGDSGHAVFYRAAIDLIEAAIDERWRQLERFAEERHLSICRLPSPLADVEIVAVEHLMLPGAHLTWLAALPPPVVEQAHARLCAITQAYHP